MAFRNLHQIGFAKRTATQWLCGMIHTMKTHSLVAVCLVAALSVSAASTSSYVQDGLIACWDGIENAGAGVHDGGATVWKDVKGGYEFSLTGVTVDADRMTFAGDASSYGMLSSNDTVSTFVAAKNGTLEIVYAARTAPGTQVMLQSSNSSGMAFGMTGSTTLLPNTSSSNSSRPKYTFNSGTTTNSVAVRYSAGVSASAIANGVALSSPSGSDYWWYPEPETYIGVRSNKSAFFPGSIYCIRLYSRQLTDAEIAANQDVDKLRFMVDQSSVLMVSGNPEPMGAPSPAYGLVTDLSAGDTREVSCGATICTNDARTAEYRCTGWKLYDANDVVVSSGAETSFTYTHPSPAEFRRLEWQWELARRFTNFSDYVQEGLIACWDGIDNAGIGVHADNVAVWKSLVGGYEFALNNVTVAANGMTFAGNANSYGVLSAADSSSTFAAATDATLEIVFRSSSSASSQVLLQSASSSSISFGYYNTSMLVAYSDASGMKPSFASSAGTEVNSVSVRYASNAPASAIANGTTLQGSGNAAWSSPGTETFLGVRASKNNSYVFAGDIYCVRLYNRQLTNAEIASNQMIDELRFKSNAVADSTFAVSSTMDGVGAPSPAYGYVCELSAGDTRAVSSDALWTNSIGTVFSCTGWKLYDENDNIVESGNTLSFTYAHPTPAAYRRLEWQWEISALPQGGGVMSYVQDGLVACWDGIENVGRGVHANRTAVWKDIVRGYEFNLNGTTVEADRMTFAGAFTSYGVLSAAGTAATFGAARNGTMEVVYVSRVGNASQVFVHTPASIGIALGETISGTTHVLVPYTTYGTEGKSAFSFTSGATTNTVAVRYAAGVPAAARANGAALALLGDAYWLSDDVSEVFVGKNNRDTISFPGSIYCIRLYNRQLTDGEIAYNNLVDQARFRGGDMDSILYVSSTSGIVGSPTPAYGAVAGLSAGETLEVSCGTVISTNATRTVEYRCTGWKLYDEGGAVVDSGDGTSFTYTHPASAEYRRLEWQWEMTKRLTDFSGYVQDGLIACWDGIDNAGAGVHADNAVVWKDIVGGYEFALTNVTVVENGISFAGNETSYGTLSAAGTAATFDAAKNGTMEVVFASRNTSVHQLLLQTPASNGMTFGYNTVGAIVVFSGSAAKPAFPFSPGTTRHSFSVRYSSGASTSPAFADGSSLNSTGGAYWTPGDSDETFVGNRASKANGFPGTIYCIRLYSRQLTAAEIVANHAVDALRFANGTPDSTLAISGTPEGIGAPVPAYGYLTELSAGDTRVVSCGKALWKDASGTNRYECVGWKLYNALGVEVESGSGTSFNYTHPTPAAHRRLEWQWVRFSGIGTVIRLF